MLSDKDLHGYQARAIDFIVNTPRCALFAEMGLGKTAIALTAAKAILDDFAVCRALIIAPLRVANGVWRQEAAKWAHLAALRDNRIAVATGNRKARDAAVNAPGCDILIINRENVEWLVKTHKWRWDFVIVDESSSFKAHNTKRFRALRSVLPKVKRLVLLTGTPSPNSLLDLWAQAFLLDRGARLGKSFYAFRQKYYWQDDYRGYKWKLRDKSQTQIQNQLADIVMALRTADYLSMPDRIDINVAVQMPDKIAAQYNTMRKTFALELNDKDAATIPIATSAAMGNKLIQFCNGAVYDEAGEAHTVHNLKIDALREIADDNPADNILVAYHYKSDLARLRKAFPEATVLSKDASEIAEWDKGKIKMLLAHPQSAGHGLNLQAGGAMIVWYGLTYSLENYAQFNARLHRQGQSKPVRIIHLIVKGGIDASILPLLSAKAETQDALMDYLRAAL